MRLFALAIAMSLAALTTASAETATPDSQNGRYSFNPVVDGVLRLDTRTGQVSVHRTITPLHPRVIASGKV